MWLTVTQIVNSKFMTNVAHETVKLSSISAKGAWADFFVSPEQLLTGSLLVSLLVYSHVSFLVLTPERITRNNSTSPVSNLNKALTECNKTFVKVTKQMNSFAFSVIREYFIYLLVFYLPLQKVFILLLFISPKECSSSLHTAFVLLKNLLLLFRPV